MAEELSIDDAKTLLALCASGRLYAVEEWISSGRSLQVPGALRKTPLQVAFTTGFHSLIELLLRHAPNQQTKDEALREAVHRRRSDLIDLALTHGAAIGAVPFVDVLGTADRSVVSTFLSRGADPVTGFPFAHAFRELKAKTPEISMPELVSTVGASQIVLGTDFAFAPTVWNRKPVDDIQDTPGLTPEQQIAILGDNAARLLNLDR